MGGRVLADPEAGKRLVPAVPLNRRAAGASAAKRVPGYMAKKLEPGRRVYAGGMLGGADCAGAMDSKSAVRVVAASVPDLDGDDYL